MYPFFRLAYQIFKHRKDDPLPITGVHVSHHICWPWDLDLWNELNNGRTLTLYDMGRVPLACRLGLVALLKTRKWGMTVAGSSVRYRRRVRMFDRIEMRSRTVCWDERFVYLEQSMWVRGEATSHILLRTAVTGKDGIVPTAQLAEVLGIPTSPPDIPEWIADWIAAEAKRPWPPMKNDIV